MSSLTLTLDQTTLAPFHDAWRQAVAQQSERDSSALLFAAQERMGALDPGRLPDFVRERLAMVPSVLALLRDREWQPDAAVRQDLAGALAYLTDPYDLIPDNEPRYGLLDDALVLEIALVHNRTEWHAWHEYDQFRRRHCDGEPLQRADWLALRRRLQRGQRRIPHDDPRAASPFHRERHSYLDEAAQATPRRGFKVH